MVLCQHVHLTLHASPFKSLYIRPANRPVDTGHDLEIGERMITLQSDFFSELSDFSVTFLGILLT